MADFLVSFDGLYINYNNTISQTPEGATVPEQLVNDASLIFDDISGRLVAFKDYIGISKNQDEEDETKSNFYGYMRLSDFFFDRKIKINDGMQWIALGGDASSDPRMYKFSFQPKNVLGESLLTLLKSNVYDVPQARDRIHLVSRVLEKNQNETSIRTKVCSFDWPQRHLMANTETMRSLIDSEGTFESGKKVEEYKFKDGPSIAITHSEIKKYYNSIVNKHKFWTYTGLETRDLTISEANGIEGIVMLWHSIHQHPTFTKNILDNQLGYIFEVHYALINDVDYQTISKAEYLPAFTSDYFLQLRQRLLVFFYNAIRLGENLGKDQVLTYILGLFDAVTLSFLRIEDKLALLNYFITGDFFTGRLNPTLSVYKLTHEEAIVKVVSSIARKDITGTVLNLDEVNRFMYWLCGSPKEQDNKALLLKDKTPYQVLYDGIDDDVFFGDTQKGALGKFVDAVHALWLVSDFNPDAKDFSLNEGPPVQYRYMTPLADTFYRESLPFDPATSPAPYIIDYNVEKFGPWYFDSFQTNFSGNKIKVLRSKSSTSGGTVGAGAAVLKNDTVTQLFGYYELFQPVSIVNIMANDTIIRMPINVKNMDQIDPNDPCKNAPLIDNSIPIFYLKYIDDKQNISNIKANIEVAVEVALTFSGIGGLTKLRYLRYLALIRPGGLTAVQQLALSRAWSVFFDIIDFGAGIASLTATLSNQCTGNNPCEQQEPSDPNSEEHRRWEACRTVQYWLLGVGLLSVGANVAVARWVRHLSKQVEGFADILALSSTELALVIKMGKVDHVATVLDDLLLEYNKLRNSLDNISLNTTQRAHFYEDFVLGQNRLPDLELLDQVNLDSAVLNWRNLRGAGYIEEAVDLSVIRRQDLVDTFTDFYADASVRTALYNHTLSKRIAFMDNFKNADQSIIATFRTDSSLVQEWFRYYVNANIRGEFVRLTKNMQLEFMQDFKSMSQDFINKLIEKPQAIKRWGSGTGELKSFAKSEPELWLYILDDMPEGAIYKSVGGQSVKHEFVDLESIIRFRASRQGPPPHFSIQSLLKFKKLSFAEQREIIKRVNESLKAGGSQYKKVVTYKGIPIPRSNNGSGVAPDFKNLGMAFDPPGSNTLGNGILDIPGLSEPLSDIIQKIKSFPAGVKVPIFDIDRKLEYRSMWQMMGINPKDGALIKKELYLEIHHLDDLDINLNTTVQLITDLAHGAAGRHSGSVKQVNKLFEILNSLN